MGIFVDYSWCSNSICGIFLHVVTQPGEGDSLLPGHFELLWSAGFDKENSVILMQFVQGYCCVVYSCRSNDIWCVCVCVCEGVCVCACVVYLVIEIVRRKWLVVTLYPCSLKSPFLSICKNTIEVYLF